MRGRLVPLSRPLLGDYICMLLGFALSLYLTALSRLQPSFTLTNPSVFLMALGQILSFLLFLPLGVILFWPIFYVIGKLAGRSQGLALGEWLWGLSWLVTLFLTVWICWAASGAAPEAVTSKDFTQAVFTGYGVYLLAMSVVAFCVWIVSLFRATLYPWTHTFALALLVWPALPLILLWSMNWQLQFFVLEG